MTLASDPYTGPIIDMHLHAFPADGNGPAPNVMCPGIAANLKYDSKEPWPAVLERMMQEPPCDNPIQGPATDEEVRNQTIEYMKKYNVRGVLSGTTDEIKKWQAAAPGLFIPGLDLNIRRDGTTPEEISRLFDAGEMEVLAEVTNQYSGVLMHAGYPFVEDLKALLYLYPQLYIGVGVLQIALPREEYYRFLGALVTSGFIDRIMFGSDQMNWPGAIEEGINAINHAPFLSVEQKQAILHDNAVRFLRLD